ncbi:hypothetical protein GLAREA_03473 [Glarea lozoyensis ATCC 20868]|uniref:Uncharacterized protein n=1 Tax=Glarea lozoyensis (strain ATCC 20868 / MF5171) TaxID=1116229 RepID=S3DEU3_GLAL2|nr:uncharacterized protein GLAREA_03473 [Glarea lozoyensis ATCC 20868]EPE30506.1 hypothetical protein GLAREA_03473 [Glarea lozoyensis ATCC 20868]
MSIQFPNRPLPPKKQTAQTFLAYFRALDREIEPWAGAIYLASELDPTTNNPTPESAEHEDDICSFVNLTRAISDAIGEETNIWRSTLQIEIDWELTGELANCRTELAESRPEEANRAVLAMKYRGRGYFCIKFSGGVFDPLRGTSNKWQVI